MVAGMMQINVTVPAGAEVAPFDQVVLTAGSYSSPTAVMIAVQ
jgi:uncharacterized protein (TIGR03437 family)